MLDVEWMELGTPPGHVRLDWIGLDWIQPSTKSRNSTHPHQTQHVTPQPNSPSIPSPPL